MRLKLTDLAIQKLPNPNSGNLKYWDSVLPGFGVRCTSRSKSFFIVYGPKRLSRTIGKYPDTTLKEARNSAKLLQATLDTSKPLKRLREAKMAFLEDSKRRLSHSTYRQYKFYLEQVDKELLTDITQSDIDTSHPHTVASWKAFMNWCLRRGYINRNPFQLVKAQTGTRSRVLADDEIRQIWAYEYPPFSNIIKLLFLTGLRRTEVTHLELVGDEFRLPPEHTKNGKGHSLPASELAKQLYVDFSFNGWSKAKKRLDREVDLDHWTLHDIRRTFATIHAKIGTPIHVVEALLNHQSGTISGIRAVYIRHNFMTEAKKALEVYEKHLQTIIAQSN